MTLLGSIAVQIYSIGYAHAAIPANTRAITQLQDDLKLQGINIQEMGKNAAAQTATLEAANEQVMAIRRETAVFLSSLKATNDRIDRYLDPDRRTDKTSDVLSDAGRATDTP